MNFVSWAFIILFLVVLAARLTIGRRKTEPAYEGVLIVAGAVFYAWHVPVFLLILLASTSVDYWAALLLFRTPDHQRTRRLLILLVSLGTNLGLLGVFKYGDLALRAVGDMAEFFQLGPRPGTLGWVLPIGISFYTFEAMSYTIDVYRKELPPLRSFPRFFLFISFFPHLVAGPIVRAGQFLPQISRPRRLAWPVVSEGVWLLTTGFFLKMVCADNIAQYVDAYWPRGYAADTDATMAGWLALMFSAQIFADFAGYSNIGRGAAFLLGYRLPVNFNAPYIAGSFKGFWERWHITLSQWLRDYLYRPLGGNRAGQRRTYANLMLVMLLGGLWHGAAFRFVAWGGIHGAALALERLFGLHRSPPRGRHWLVTLLWFGVVQVVVLVAWVFFRSETVANGVQFVANLIEFDFRMPERIMLSSGLFVLPIVVHHGWSAVEERGYVRPPGPMFRAALVGAMLLAIATLSTSPSAFIYFQF